MNISISNIDAWAVMITVLGYIVVFIALAILVIAFVRLKRVLDFFTQKKWKRLKGERRTPAPVVPETTGDMNAAICTALYLYFSELHDEEKYVMTIKKVSRNYSPWSSKLYGAYDVLKQK